MDPFIGQLILFGGNFAPRGWAKCEGQLLAIASHSALFSLLGTTYGGDGRTTFGLPDLRGRVPMGAGEGPGLSPRSLGERSGTETNSLSVAQLPNHDHTASGTVLAFQGEGDNDTPAGHNFSNSESDSFTTNGNSARMATNVEVKIERTGGNQPVNNIQPSLAMNYIIALEGIFPSRP